MPADLSKLHADSGKRGHEMTKDELLVENAELRKKLFHADARAIRAETNEANVIETRSQMFELKEKYRVEVERLKSTVGATSQGVLDMAIRSEREAIIAIVLQVVRGFGPGADGFCMAIIDAIKDRK